LSETEPNIWGRDTIQEQLTSRMLKNPAEEQDNQKQISFKGDETGEKKLSEIWGRPSGKTLKHWESVHQILHYQQLLVRLHDNARSESGVIGTMGLRRKAAGQSQGKKV